jgi:transposase
VSKRRLVITAVLTGMSQSEAARTYGVSQGWISRLMTHYAAEGEAAFEPRSRAPKSRPAATPPATVELVLSLRKQLAEAGLDAGAIGWHLQHHHRITLSRATIDRILARAGQITPEPSKRPKSSYIRFQAEQPNETWQSDFTHYRLTHPDGRPGPDAEIITWLDDRSRYALHISAHTGITAAIVLATFRQATGQHGHPASTLTDNGMVYTVRFAGGRGGRTALETELRRMGIVQKNSRPNHPTTCGKVERFQQTLKRWLHAQPQQPRTITQLQTLIDVFIDAYNQPRPHRSLPHRRPPTTPARKQLPAPTAPTTPTTGSTTTNQQSRHHHPARPRPATPHRHRHRHRHRQNLRRNLRHPARPRPQRPRHQRHHRKGLTRAHHRPPTRLPAHRPATRTHPHQQINPNLRLAGSGYSDVLRHRAACRRRDMIEIADFFGTSSVPRTRQCRR